MAGHSTGILDSVLEDAANGVCRRVDCTRFASLIYSNKYFNNVPVELRTKLKEQHGVSVYVIFVCSMLAHLSIHRRPTELTI